MKLQKGFLSIALTLIVIIALLGVGGYFLFAGKNTKLNEASNISDWKQIEFPEDYYHSVNSMYPSGWDIEVGIDTEGYRSLYIYQKSSASVVDGNGLVKPKGPLVIMYDYALVGCPNGNVVVWDCGLENVRKVTAEEYINHLVKNLDRDGNMMGEITSLKKSGSVKLNNFTKDALVYHGISRSGEPADLYILQPENGVIGVVFQQPDAFDANFKTEFFNRLTSN
ncbi:hypothetical protein KW786_03290 [Candidatus Parcubacteria bacterium]|nr:hypothetical protein [Candidatus Parcubacteria bacterium]